MIGLYVMLGGMLFFATLLVVFDWLGQRQRLSRGRKP